MMAPPGHGAPPPGYTGTTVIVAPGGVLPGMASQAVGAVDMLSALAGLQGLFVSQDIRLLEALGICEQNNGYKIFGWNPALGHDKPKDGRFGEPLIRVKEKTNCLVRQVCGPRRGFRMYAFPDSPRIATFQPGTDPTTFKDSLIFERPFRCTFLCFWRSIVRVRHPSLGYIGEIYNPFACFDTIFHVRAPTQFDDMKAPIAEAVKGDDQGKVHYIIRGECLQWGMWFPPLPCGPCKKVSFLIYAGNDTAMTRPVGEISKVWSGCLKEAVSDADNFTVAFPPDATPIQKALLAAAVIHLDFLLFEKQESKNDNGVMNILSLVA
jgi:hypothetical protein